MTRASSDAGPAGLAARAGRWLWWGVVFVATLEVAARIDDRIRWQAPLAGVYSNAALVTRDSVVIRGRPGYRYEKWGINSAGFRGGELDTTLAPGVARIVVLGASETFGLFESEGAEYPAQMQILLDSLAPGRFEVVNAGLPGMSPAAMIPYLQHVVRPLQPSHVVVYPSPSFFLDNRPPQEEFRLPPRSAPSGAKRVSVLGVPRLRIITKSKTVAKRILPPTLLLKYREYRLWRARRGAAPDWVWTEVPADRMAQFERQMRSVVATIESLGAHPVLATHTNRFLHHKGPLTASDRQHRLAIVSGYYPRASDAVIAGVDSSANNILRRIAGASRASVVETEGRMRPDSTHFADYAHFTDAGARAMAEVIVAHLLRSPDL